MDKQQLFELEKEIISTNKKICGNKSYVVISGKSIPHSWIFAGIKLTRIKTLFINIILNIIYKLFNIKIQYVVTPSMLTFVFKCPYFIIRIFRLIPLMVINKDEDYEQSEIMWKYSISINKNQAIINPIWFVYRWKFTSLGEI